MNIEFQVGQKYECTSVASGKCRWHYRVASRKDGFVRLIKDNGKVSRLKVLVVDNVERCFPNPRLKLGLILTANDLATN